MSVSLPDDVAAALDQATRDEGITSNELIGKAVRQYVFLRKYRVLRDRLASEAAARGISSDRDVFDRVS